jgi:MoxR-like ATPase
MTDSTQTDSGHADSGQTSSPPQSTEPGTGQDALRSALAQVRTEVGRAVVGQDGAVTGLIIALLARGHVLLEGVPGVAKTLLVRALSRTLSLDTKRVQFTPDLMPGDVTGSLVYDPRAGEFEFREGPVFTNILLADEINRTPPKTQSALLEAMEERQVSADGVSRPVPEPFIVAATQNPIEYEGTYSLPEAQLDRFLLKLVLDIPERDVELEVLRRHAAGFDPRDLAAAGVRAVLDAGQLRRAQAAVASVGVSPDVLGYVVDLARATRQSPSVKLGVSPRGTTALLAAARAWGWLCGYDSVTPDHVQAMLLPVWRHRVQLRPEAELEGVAVDAILRSIVQQVQVPI